MSRSDADVIDDIAAAIESIHAHLQHGPISVEIVMDAVAMRLLEIGEAVKALAPDLIASEPDIPWGDIAGMRDFLAHHYVATSP
ncbi:MAG: HepT-like ribonuclease domain-containing protein, partial [Nocardioides sp.]